MFRFLFPLVIALATALPASAIGLIRDAEIERTLKRLSKPLLQAAGISPASTNIFIVNSNSMNAFVTAGNNIFIHSGLVRRMDRVELLQAVIAHEIGHIAGNHVASRSIAFANSRTAAGLGMLLGLAVAASGNTEGGIGLAAGASSAAQRNLFANTRAQESSADQSGVRYMAAAGIDPKAAIEALKFFEGQDLITAARRDPYVQTHPLSQQRINNLRNVANAYKPKASGQVPNIDYWYDRMVAKFDGFINPSSALKKYKRSDKSEAATLARAIAYSRKPDVKRGQAEINKLLKMRPRDAFYWELKGQFLLESNQVAPAVTAYQNAVNLAPNEPLLIAGLGRALLAAKSGKALGVLQRAYAKDPRDARMLRDLATAYARAGKKGQAAVVTAERYALQGNFPQAAQLAKRAQGLLPKGTSGWLKADEILGLAERA